jgi:hypothetical protein
MDFSLGERGIAIRLERISEMKKENELGHRVTLWLIAELV